MGQLSAIVLGSAAGGGFPQWNCRCAVCRRAWVGDRSVRARTQASLAVSVDGERWALINASPDLRTQILGTSRLHPRGEARGSPVAAVILTGAEIDQSVGLLSLRERSPFSIYATTATLMAVAANPMFGALTADVVARSAIVPGASFSPLPGLEAELFLVPGKVPLYLEGDNPETAAETAANVGIELSDGTRRLVYVPGAAAVTPALLERFSRADVLMFDGTLFTDDEMIRSGTGEKTGRRMGHMPVDGPGGSLAMLAGIAARRIFTHINNTNPMLVENAPERARVVAAGWEIAEDGMEIVP